MAQSSTIDNQKLFGSATKNFSSFVGGVENVSHTRHMEEIYANMGKLFDAFTKGALMGQGANSEWILRTIHKSLDDRFLDIIQNDSAVDKIVELIKENQKNAAQGSPMVSQTTKNVVLNKLNPQDCNPQEVILDFVDELQSDILKVKINLSREYERQKLAWAKSAEGQKQDLDRLNQEFKDQNQEMLDTLGQLSNQDAQWSSEQLSAMDKLMSVFSKFAGEQLEQSPSKVLDKKPLDGNLPSPRQSVANVQLPQPSASRRLFNITKKLDGRNTKGTIDKSLENGRSLETDRSPEVEEAAQHSVEDAKPVEQEHRKEYEKEDEKEEEQKKTTEKTTKETTEETTEKPTGEIDNAEKQLQALQKAHVDSLGKPISVPDKGRISVSPTKSGMCTCPICSNVHPLDGKHKNHNPQADGKGSRQSTQEKGNLTQEGVETTLGKIHENIQRQMKNKKFQNAFMMDYGGAQRGINKQMAKIDKDEHSVSQQIEQGKHGIDKLKKRGKGRGLLGLMLGGIASFAFIAIGALILITLTRMALAKWKETYMPKSDGSKLTIFGISIPGWGQIKAIGIGIRNFIVVGLPNYLDRLKRFFGGVQKTLFGKKGVLRDMAEVKNTLRRIIAAWIIGQTKKVGGKIASLVLQAIGWAFCWVPGVQPVCNFLAKFGPEIWAFATNQIMKLWSDGRAEAERSAQQDIASQNAGTRGMINSFRIALHGAAAKVKTYDGQELAIPGLQTSNGKNGELPKRAAIMRHMPTIYGKNAKRAAAIQNKKVEADQEARKDQQELTKSKLISAKRGSVMGDLGREFSLSGAMDAKYWNDQWKKNIELRKQYGNNKALFMRKLRRDVAQKMLVGGAIGGQIKMLDAYIAQLSQSPRFKGVTGPLYHPESGWNPGYRVFASDLMSPIPLEPFESLHDRADVPIGTPVESETGSIGFMPFTWMQNGSRISVNPVGYELERAKAIRKLYVWAAQQAGEAMGETDWFGNDQSMSEFNKVLQKKGGKIWLEWNNAVAKRSMFDYENRDKVVYGDKFRTFINKFRENRMSDADNDLDVVVGNKKKPMAGEDKAALVGGVAGGVLGGAVGAVVGSAAARVGYRVGGKTAEAWNRTMNYDKGPDPSLAQRLTAKGYPTRKLAETEYRLRKNVAGEDMSKVDEEVARIRREKKYGKGYVRLLFGDKIGGAMEGIYNKYQNIKRKASVIKRMSMWRDVEWFGIKYGTIRDLMFDAGLFELLTRSTIMNTVGSVVPVLEWMVKKGLMPGKKSWLGVDNALGDLMKNFFDFAGIKGYDWNRVKTSKKVLAGFAQSFLEYLKFRFLPVWNWIERLLSKDISNQTPWTEKTLRKALIRLHESILPKSIFKFMLQHLRFPTMQVNLVDYSNADALGRRRIDEYKAKLGIPGLAEKEGILGQWSSVWGKIGQMPDAALEASMEKLKAQIQKAEFEARFTGDYTYFRQLKQYWTKMQDERSKRLTEQTQGNKVVKKAGDIQQSTKIVEPPPKSLAEIEEEKRKREAEEAARKAEEERKAKEERERKLKEEAKRKEELVIAEAKIKAAEAIRKQEQNYETILGKLIEDPGKVTDKDLKSLGDDVNSIKQEAENRITKLPREERELKLALIRGDKISEKTFTEVKETAVGLHGNLQEYVEEVNKIPVGSAMVIQNTPSVAPDNPVRMQDSDAVDLGDS